MCAYSTTAVFLVVCLGAVLGQTETWLESPRVTNFGTWGEPERCPDNHYVYGFRLKVHPDQGWLLDDTAVNAIELSCLPESKQARSTLAPVPITGGAIGQHGNWGTQYECNEGTFAIGFELRSEAPTLDNTAANNLRIRCSDENILEGVGQAWGSWTGPLNCPRGTRLCGLRTQVEVPPKPQPADNTGLNNVDMLCCDIEK